MTAEEISRNGHTYYVLRDEDRRRIVLLAGQADGSFRRYGIAVGEDDFLISVLGGFALGTAGLEHRLDRLIREMEQNA